ncbi:MAG: ABC transporter permease [Longimicrobiales bacterium]
MRDGLRRIAIVIRSLARRPGYAATVIVTLAIGIGATTAIYSVLQGSILRPLPYPQPERLLYLRSHHVPTDRGGPLSIPNFLDLRREATTFEELAAYISASANLATADQPVRARARVVTTNFFRALGVGPALGRGFVEGEDRAGAGKVVAITDQLWEEAFARRPDVLGQTLQLNAELYTVVGVLPPSFWFPENPLVIVPFAWSDRQLTQNRGSRLLGVFGRMRADVTATAADTEIKTIFSRLAVEYPGSNEVRSIKTFDVRDWMLGVDRRSLWLLSGAVLLVLLIGCVNVANLMLVRAERRKREFAVLAAICAGRGRLAYELVVESLMIAFAGALLAVSGAERDVGGGLRRADGREQSTHRIARDPCRIPRAGSEPAAL